MEQKMRFGLVLGRIWACQKIRRLTQKISYPIVRANNAVTCVSSVENQTCIIMLTDYGHTKAKPLFFAAQIQIPIPNNYLGCGYKGLLFVKLLINGKHGQGTHNTKMGTVSSAENTPNALKFICPICLPKPKSLGFR